MTKVTKIDIKDIDFQSGKATAIEALIRGGYSFAESEKEWKEHGAGTKQRGFRSYLYDLLAETSLSDSEILAEAKEHGSENDIKQVSHYYAIGALVRAIREG